jgi:hypothetical protein
MSRAIVHVGAGKTGSTAVQYFLAHNAHALRDLGFTYPIVAAASTRPDGANHNRLAYELIAPRPGRAERKMAKALAKSASESPVTLISAEVLYMRPYESEFASAQSYLEAKEAALDRLFRLLDPFDTVDVIAYLRRHDRWIESIYNERIKTGRERSATFAEFASSYGRNVYLPQLEAWARRLRGGRLTVRPYEAAMRGEGGLIGDFRRAVGIACNVPQAPTSRRSVNPALGRDFVEFARLAQRLPIGRRARARLTTGLGHISARQLSAQPEPTNWGLFFTYAERVSFLAEFKEDDAEVERKYLSDDFEYLFEEPSSAEHADYPGLSVERGFEIAAELLEYDRALGSPLVLRGRRLTNRIRGRE